MRKKMCPKPMKSSMLEQPAFEKEKASKVDEIADVKTDRQQLAFEKEKASKVDAARSALADRSRL